MKCDQCNNPAAAHLTEVKKGQKIERHLCTSCFHQISGFAPGDTTGELLEKFVLRHAGVEEKPGEGAE